MQTFNELSNGWFYPNTIQFHPLEEKIRNRYNIHKNLENYYILKTHILNMVEKIYLKIQADKKEQNKKAFVLFLSNLKTSKKTIKSINILSFIGYSIINEDNEIILYTYTENVHENGGYIEDIDSPFTTTQKYIGSIIHDINVKDLNDGYAEIKTITIKTNVGKFDIVLYGLNSFNVKIF